MWVRHAAIGRCGGWLISPWPRPTRHRFVVPGQLPLTMPGFPKDDAGWLQPPRLPRWKGWSPVLVNEEGTKQTAILSTEVSRPALFYGGAELPLRDHVGTTVPWGEYAPETHSSPAHVYLRETSTLDPLGVCWSARRAVA